MSSEQPRATAKCLLGIIVSLLFGCSSIDRLPATNQDIDFSNQRGHITEWGIYQIGRDFQDTDIDTVIKAATAGLQHANFTIIKIDIENRFVAGNRGMVSTWSTLYPPATVAVYLKENGADVQVMVVYDQGWGIIENEVVESTPLEIFAGMHLYLMSEDNDKSH